MLLLFGGGPAMADPFADRWCVLSHGPLRLISNLTEADSHALATRLLMFHAAAEHYLPGTRNTASPEPTLLVFTDLDQLTPLLPDPTLAGFMLPALDEHLLVAARQSRMPAPDASIFHEYSHYLLRTRSGIGIPTWFDEGLASLLAGVTFESTADDGDAVLIGRLPVRNIRYSIDQSRLPIHQALATETIWQLPPLGRQAFYGWSALLVHYLYHGREEELAAARARVDAFLGADEWDLEGLLARSGRPLERELRDYSRRDLPTRRFSAPPQQTAPAEFACMDELTRDRWLSRAITQHNPKLAVARLAQRLAEHPDVIELWIDYSAALQASGARTEAVTAAEHAIAIDPDNTAARIRLAEAFTAGCELRRAAECFANWQRAIPLLRAALADDPTQPNAILGLGLAHLHTNRPGDALNYLRIAQQRAPWAPQVNFYLGEAYRLTGDRRARAYLERAGAWSPLPFWQQASRLALEQLDAP